MRFLRKIEDVTKIDEIRNEETRRKFKCVVLRVKLRKNN